MIIPHTKQSLNLAQISLHRLSPVRIGLIASLIVLLFALVLPGFVRTMGAPLERALIKQAEFVANRTVDVYDSAPLESVISFDDDTVANATTDTNTTRPALSLEAEDFPLPSRFLPDAVPLFLMILAVSLTCVYFLSCRWSVWFKVKTQFEPADSLQADSTLVFVEPMENRGIPALVPVTRNKLTNRFEFCFQRQMYEILAPGAIAEGDVISLGRQANSDDDDGRPSVLRSRLEALALEVGYARVLVADVHLPIDVYLNSPGLASPEEIERQRLKFGLNTLSVPQPPFTELLQAQLLMPLSVFQIFSALLWAIDEYIQFTLFTLLTIVMMESATAFQRHRTMQQLAGLSPKPFAVMAKRCGSWAAVSSVDLLPGDLISLHMGDKSNPDSYHDLVPCDALILAGSAIVNEATLTGESIPQMKDQILSEDRNLNIDSSDRIHTVFSGTSVVAVGAPTDPSLAPPDGGCLCVVLRTGFGSSQGELMQMIEFSQKAVSADNWETAASLGILLVFGLASAIYGVVQGLKKGDKTDHQLLLRAIITVTNVVPRQLPVQMSLQVNHALMTLMKQGIFCTEPFRVPTAGKITHALFDKTGTLTSDELVPSGVCQGPGGHLHKLVDASPDCQLVLACCHSLVALPGHGQAQQQQLLGDPIELAAVRGLQWGFEPTTSMCTPGDVSIKLALLKQVEERQAKASGAALLRSLEEEAEAIRKHMTQISAKAKGLPIARAQIVKRFHFDASLQRMSVLALVEAKDGSSRLQVLVKGSPEALKPLLVDAPEWYEREYLILAEKGMRVLALAHRVMDSQTSQTKDVKREHAEHGLTFCGFVAFECKTRADSPAVVTALRQAAIAVQMVTGDAPLTALSVARECRLVDGKALMLDGDGLRWVGALQADRHVEFAVDLQASDCGLAALATAGYALVATEAALERLAVASDGRVWTGMHCVAVLARMSPRGKAKVIRAIQKDPARFVLMCGDGGNDVGALKQADVGLALLSGYGSANTSGGLLVEGEDALNVQQDAERVRMSKLTKLKKQALDAKRAELQALQPQWMAEELAKLGPQPGMLGHMSAVKAAAMRMGAELNKESALLDKKYGGIMTDPLGEAAAETGMPAVRPGDASVAAPFTSRVPSVRSVVHLIRQGRCTLLGALQQHQTMMIECVMHAYCHALISLEGARNSERQLMVSGWAVMAASLAFSYATPAERMHPCKPLRSVFEPAVISSMIGQCVIHLFCLQMAAEMAKRAMGPDALAQVVAFNKKLSAGTLKEDEKIQDEEDPFQALASMWGQPFMPNLMNTTVFLIETAQIVAVLVVNYKGRPFMRGLMENHVLFMSLFATTAGIIFAAWEFNPTINHAVHFKEFPDDEYRWKVLGLLALSLVGTFLWDRACLWWFAPKIFQATVEEARKTQLSDLIPVAFSLVKVMVGFFVLATGNPLIWAGAYYGNQRLQAWFEAEEEKRLREREQREGN